MKTRIDKELIDPTDDNRDEGEIIPRKEKEPVEPGKRIPLND